MRRRNILSLRLTDEEFRETKELAKQLSKPMTEIWRTYYDFSKIFYSELTLGDALMINERTLPIHMLLNKKGDLPLCECMRPFEELASILRAKRILDAEAEQKRKRILNIKPRT